MPLTHLETPLPRVVTVVPTESLVHMHNLSIPDPAHKRPRALGVARDLGSQLPLLPLARPGARGRDYMARDSLDAVLLDNVDYSEYHELFLAYWCVCLSACVVLGYVIHTMTLP